jgi:uncharacterized protein YjlB
VVDYRTTIVENIDEDRLRMENMFLFFFLYIFLTFQGIFMYHHWRTEAQFIITRIEGQAKCDLSTPQDIKMS